METSSKKDCPKEKICFEDILKQVGEFGPFQIRIFTLLTLMDLSMGQCMMYFVFANMSPTWWKCTGYTALTANSSIENLFTPYDNYYSMPNNVSNHSMNDPVKSGAGKCYSGDSRCERFEFSSDYRSIISEWSLVCDLSSVPKHTVSIQMVGVLLGALVAGQVADIYGRKRTVVVVTSAMMVMQTLVSLANSWPVYATLRFFVGVFIGGSMCLSCTIPMEFIGPKWRSFCGSFGIFPMGLMMQSLWAFSLRNWRYQAIISGLSMTILLPLIIIYVPESVRWLIQNNRFDEAEAIMKKLALCNKKPVPDLSSLHKIAAQDLHLKTSRKRYSYPDLFSTLAMARKSATMSFVWFTCSVVLYGISTQYSTLYGDIYINTVVDSCITLPFSWSVIWTANRFGRRRTFCGYMSIPCLAILVVISLFAAQRQHVYGGLTTALVLLGKASTNACWLVAAIYANELYPTLMRNIAMASCSMFARIGGILTPQITQLGAVYNPCIPYIVYCTLAFCSLLAVHFVLPETKDKPLPEIDDCPVRTEDATDEQAVGGQCGEGGERYDEGGGLCGEGVDCKSVHVNGLDAAPVQTSAQVTNSGDITHL